MNADFIFTLLEIQDESEPNSSSVGRQQTLSNGSQVPILPLPKRAAIEIQPVSGNSSVGPQQTLSNGNEIPILQLQSERAVAGTQSVNRNIAWNASMETEPTIYFRIQNEQITAILKIS